ncbi:hypothetical protein [Rhizobium sp. C4]|uniref:hypothetical protein n=1 Tax=Rhizobium sp. C4 TaxID=1349800 RepID=UPI001E59867D|nr:hypothetical protein [Rhizobium sp. C4]MCD2175052.1 hypothetical protein [Rhizobium sp. C4]
MAILDPRLLQLFETLVAAGADWLVFELVEGIDAGVVNEESSDDLALARVLARQDREPRRTADRVAVSVQSSPLEGDEQLSWAAHYVAERLENALDMMDVSIDRMHRLVINGDPMKDSSAAQSSVNFSLQDDGEAALVTVEDRSAGQLAVRELHVALERWLGEATERRKSL